MSRKRNEILTYLGILCVLGILIYLYKQRKEFRDDIDTNADTKKDSKSKLFKIPPFTPRKKTGVTNVDATPLVIYQTWHSHEVPEGMKKSIESLIKKNPEFDYHLYSDDECLEFIKTNFDEEVVTAFKTLKPGAYKSDLWRYCVLYKNGGVYLDIKFDTIIPLISIVQTYQEVYVKDVWPDCQCKEGLYNAFMISPPGNEIFNDCIRDIVISTKDRLYRRNDLDISGPCLLGRMVMKHKPSEYLEKNPFQFKKRVDGNDVDGITLENKLIIKAYKTYRSEQKQFQKTERYGDLYRARDIYN